MRDSVPHLARAGQEVVEAAGAGQVQVRLLGGVAIWLRGTAEARSVLGRDYADFDLIAHKRDSRRLRTVLESLGFQANQMFNAIHGARRLMYYGHDPEYHIDIFLDEFQMSHKLDLGRRLQVEELTLPAADLLLTKLQIAELNRKDASDVVLLLWSHELGDRDRAGQLNLRYVAQTCADDWGLYTTAADNLKRVTEMLGELPLPDDGRALVLARLGSIAAALEHEPKSMLWRLRDRVGRRVRWYELPEEVQR